MDQIGERRFQNIPGDPDKIYELPPLIMAGEVTEQMSGEKVIDIVENDGLIELPESIVPDENSMRAVEMARIDLAHNLTEQYKKLIADWYLGEFILEWIRQCETTFMYSTVLRTLIPPNLWPRADRVKIATLLTDKSICEEEDLRQAIGMRLSFRKLPPVEVFSDHFLFYIAPVVLDTAYNTWIERSPSRAVALPPERFHFEVLVM
ncbi:MAG: hypothetical protein WCK48_01190 [bacterium]